MERSMVQELSGMNNSQFVTNRSTFISTAFNQGDYQLRKSRIQNLPSYRKQDLSSKMNFVVVFQAIQIQRLSNEVQALRVALKDSQREIFNVQNYQIQIRQLTQKCFAYESEREQYRDEVDKLNMICQKLYQELQIMKSRFSDIDPTIRQKYLLEKQRTQKLQQQLQRWKARYSALQTSKNRQMEDMKLMMESQRKSVIDRQLKQMTLKFNSERQNLQKQIRKLRENLQSKESQLNKKYAQISHLQIIIQELKKYQDTIDQYENKFAMISQQTVRLNQLLRAKQEQIDRLNSNQIKYKKIVSQLQKRVRDAEEGGEKARALQDQLRQWKARYSKIQDQNREYKQQLGKIPQFQKIIQQINNQSDKLKDVVRQKMGQIDDWKNRCHRVQSQFKQNKAHQQQKLPLLQNKLAQLGNENDRINNTLKSRTGEIQNWKNKYSDIEKQIQRYKNVEQDKKNLQNQLNVQLRQINELQGNTKQLQAQLKRLGDIQRDLSNQRSQKQQIKRQIERLNNAVRSTTQKADNFEKKCLNLERDLKTFSQISQQLRIYKQKQINLTKQIDRINGIILEKIKQIQALKQTFQRFEKGLSQYQGIQKRLMQSVNQTQKLIHDLDQSRKQAAFLQDKLVNSESQARKLKNDVIVLSQQKQQTIRLINTKTQQIQQVKMQLSQLQNQISQLRQKQMRLREIQEKLRITENNLNEVDRKLKSEQSKSKDLNNSLEQASTELLKIKRQGMMTPQFKQQFFTLKNQSEQRIREIQSLNQRIANIEGIIRKLKQVIIKQDQIAKRNTDKFTNVAKQLDVGTQAMKKMFDLQGEIIKLNQDNMQLEGKIRLISLENDNLKQSYNNKGVGVWESESELPQSFSSTVKKSQSVSANSRQGNQVPNAPFSRSNSTNNTQKFNSFTIGNLRTSNFSPPTALTPNYAVTNLTNNYNFGVLPQSNSSLSNLNSASALKTDSYTNLETFKTKIQPSTNQFSSKFQFRTSSNTSNKY